MKTIYALAIALMCCGCTTVCRQASGKLDKIVIPEIDFHDARVSDAIEFVVQAIEPEPPGPPRLSGMATPGMPGVPEAQKGERFAQLREYCQRRTITIHLNYCSLRAFADFTAAYAGVSYRIRDCHVTVLGRNGEVLVK